MSIDVISIHTTDSALLSEIKWEKKSKDNGTLFITFNNSEIYEYTKVPYNLVKEFITSDSFGKFFHTKIKDQFDTYKEIS